MSKFFPAFVFVFLGCMVILALLGLLIQASANAIQATANAAQSTANLVTQCTNALMVMIALLGGVSGGILFGMKRSAGLNPTYHPRPTFLTNPPQTPALPENKSLPSLPPIITAARRRETIQPNDENDAFSLRNWGW
jgi:hypothetical protein